MNDEAKIELALNTFREIELEVVKIARYAYEAEQVKLLCQYAIKALKDGIDRRDKK